MKKALFILAGLVLAAAPALADFGHGEGIDGGRMDYTRVAGYYTGAGGEFTLQQDGTYPFLVSNEHYSSLTKGKAGAESFQTFCVERDEYIYDNLRAWISTENLDGGVPGSHSWQGGVNTDLGDDLDPRTAYLYTQFATGKLSGYHYALTGTDPTSGLTRAQSAGELQEAIWKIEQEISTATGQAAKWITEAQSAIDAGTWSGIGDVRILQMYELKNGEWTVVRQDRLYYIPAPAAIVLGLIGLGVAGWIARRMA